MDGKANAELVGLVAGHFDLPKSRVSAKSGASGPMKLVRIDIEWTEAGRKPLVEAGFRRISYRASAA